MAVIQAENVLDFVADTLKDLGKPKFTDISSNLQDHPAAKRLIKQKRVVLSSGSGIQYNVLVGQSNAFRHVSLGESDNVNLVDGMVQASTVWRNSQTSYMMIRQLINMNREPARIVDYVKQQRIMSLISLVEGMETTFWTAPPASDGKTPLGLPYWCPKNATKGFNGGTLTGYTTVAGLSPTTYPNWNNWTAPYTAVSRDDFIRQCREAAVKTNFKPTTEGIPSAQLGSSDLAWFCNYATLQPLEEAVESQNDNLGPDLASQDGKVMLRRLPVTYVPWLDRDTTNPMYMLDFSWFKIYALEGEWMKETMIANTPGQHTVSSHFIDLTWQFLTKNRRPLAVISNGTSYPS